MRHARAVLLLLAALTFAAPARAGLPPSSTQMILRQATSPADLRARLFDFAEENQKSHPMDAGEAWYFCGESYARADRPDSAIVCWQQALAVRGSFDERSSLTEALLARNGSGDVDHAIALVSPALAEARAENDPEAVHLQALLAWAQLRAGQPDKAVELFRDVAPQLGSSQLWTYRYARAHFEAGDMIPVLQTLQPLAVASRGTSSDVIDLMQKAADRIGQSAALEKVIVDKLAARDAIEQRAIEQMGGRRVRYAASDGFALSGVALIPAGVSRPKTAIVMMSPRDTVADFDSLSVALRRGGFAVMLADARGSGWAVGASCPLAEAWRGREEVMLHRSARDVRDAVHALAKIARLDTSAVLVVGSRDMALAAAEAAAGDRRVRALVLLSPDPAPVDRGVLVATLARRRLPAFLQQTSEDFPNFDFTDLDLHACDEPASRISDAIAGGTGAVAFRRDPRVMPRFEQWLAETMRRPAKPATPPSTRR